MSRTYVTVLLEMACWPGGMSRSEPFCNLCHVVSWRSLLPQIRLDDLECDRRGGIGAEATALNDDADRDLRVASGREAGEDGIIEMRIIHAILRGPGLARDQDAGGGRTGGEVGGSGGVLGDLLHHLRQREGWTRYGRIVVPWLAIVAAIIASCSGVSRSLNCPMADRAIWAGSVSGG